MKVMSSREFNQDVSQAKRAARLAPVFVTDRGKPTHVLLSIDAFRRLSGERETIVDLLAMRDDASDTVAVTPDATPWNGVP
jgi:prevent-host-death family protein